MESKLIKEKQDLRFLKWAHARKSGGTAGTFLKSESDLNGIKKYYKLSNFDPERGVVGHECVNELIVDRLLTVLGVDHLNYELINADIEIEGRTYSTYLCASKDFKGPKETKTSLEYFYGVNAEKGESHYDFCVRYGWQDYVDTMLAVDYLIQNRDRHGANIEVLRNPGMKSVRLAPMFDHGLSLLFSCTSEQEAIDFDVMKDRECQNFIGGRSCYENLKYIKHKDKVFAGRLKESDRAVIMEGLDGILPDVYLEKIWTMILERYKAYEDF